MKGTTLQKFGLVAIFKSNYLFLLLILKSYCWKFKLKNKRSIKIRQPQLREIRNNLRKILQLAKSSELHNLLDQQINIQNSSHFWDKEHPQYNEMRKEVGELASRVNELNSAYNASIIKCPVCMRIDQDMTYNPVFSIRSPIIK